MAELEHLRSLPFELAAPSEEARARARGRLLRHVRHSRAARRRRLLVPALALAGAGIAAALIGVGTHGDGNAAAAVALRHAAAVARTRPAPPPLRAGEFWYTKSVQAFIDSAPEQGWSALVPRVREIWQGPSGGVLREQSGTPQFLTEHDRRHWIAAGRPQVEPPTSSTPLSPSPSRDLPSDPNALYAAFHTQAEGNGNGTDAEMFTLVGDALRETDEPPAVRAALYEVAGRIPGVRLLGLVTDRSGRTGLAVAYDSSSGIRSELIFDAHTSALLEERDVALEGNQFGYAPGTVTGFATYVSSGVVTRVGATP